MNNPGNIAPVAVFVRQRMINVVEKELKHWPQLKKEIPFPPDRSPSASIGATSDEESKTRCSRREHRDRKIKNTGVARKTRRKSAVLPTDHDHLLMQKVV